MGRAVRGMEGCDIATHKKMNHVAHKCWLTNNQAIKHCEVTSHTVRLLHFCAKEKDHTSPMFNMDITHFQFDFFSLNSVMWVNTKPQCFFFLFSCSSGFFIYIMESQDMYMSLWPACKCMPASPKSQKRTL